MYTRFEITRGVAKDFKRTCTLCSLGVGLQLLSKGKIFYKLNVQAGATEPMGTDRMTKVRKAIGSEVVK